MCLYCFLPIFWNSWEAWKENLLLSRFAAPTSAGILFTMLAAIGLKSSWIYKKIQVLAIFDDLDTILLMIPLQIMMIGLRWQLIIVVVIVFLLLSIGWQRLNKYDWRQDWKAILFYSMIIFLATQILYLGSKELYGDEGSIHIEVLLPAFVLGMIMKHKEHDTPVERKVSTGISFFLHVPGGNEYAAFYRSELCGDSCWFLFRDWFAGDDVVGNDYVSCGDCLFIVEYRKALSDVLLS